MARVSTTSFSYKGKLYTAVVSQVDGAVNIYVPDEDLHGILPNGKASFHPAQGLKIDRPRLSPAQHLLLNILTTVAASEEPIKKVETNA
ncbi:MAG TPA: hypothetical protein VM871_10380 [Flavisolibacter sp.]|nr:hypothetical protein [Flavisolibacter sp.]